RPPPRSTQPYPRAPLGGDLFRRPCEAEGSRRCDRGDGEGAARRMALSRIPRGEGRAQLVHRPRPRPRAGRRWRCCSVISADRQPDLRRKLRRSKSRARLRGLLLVAPALLLLLVAFVAPIGGMMFNAVANPEFRSAMPRLADYVRKRDGQELPGEEGYRLLAEEIGRAYSDKTLPGAAMRLNYEQSRLRSLFMRAGRRADRLEAPYSRSFLELDEDWGSISVWQAMQAASAPFTARYLLQAVDREMTWDGEIRLVEPEKRVFVDRFEATFWISFVVTALCARSEE